MKVTPESAWGTSEGPCLPGLCFFLPFPSWELSSFQIATALKHPHLGRCPESS